MLFPSSPPFNCPQLTLELGSHGDVLPRILWTGVVSSGTAEPSGYPSVFRGPGGPMLGEHAHELFTRPHLRGHRVRTTGPRENDGLDDGVDAAWSTRFTGTKFESTATHLRITAADPQAGLARFFTRFSSRSALKVASKAAEDCRTPKLS